MKKIITSLIAFCVVLSMSITAMAAPSYDEVQDEAVAIADYITNGVAAYSVDEAIDFWNLTDSGKDLSAYNEAFFASVKSNLDANAGKIVVYGNENIAVYAAVIATCCENDIDPTDFNGYNIVSAMLALDPTVAFDNPYYYRTAVPLIYTFIEDADDFAKKLCDTLIANYYVMGQGLNYWGFSCDNTASFLAAVAPFYDDYVDVINDAVAVVEKSHTEKGYCYDPNDTAYGGNAPSSNTTGVTLLAFSSLYLYSGDEKYSQLADEAYELLLGYEQGKGIFTFDGTPSLFSCKDALIGVNAYRYVVIINASSEEPDEEEPTESEQVGTENEVSKDISSEKNKNDTPKSPQTGADYTVISVGFALLTATATTLAVRKKNR